MPHHTIQEQLQLDKAMPRGWLPASPHAERGEQPAAGSGPGEMLQESDILRAKGSVLRLSCCIATKSAACAISQLPLQFCLVSCWAPPTCSTIYSGRPLDLNADFCLQDRLRAHQICRIQHASAAALSTRHSSAQVPGEVADDTLRSHNIRPIQQLGRGLMRTGALQPAHRSPS